MRSTQPARNKNKRTNVRREIKRTTIHKSCRDGDLSFVQEFLTNGIDVNLQLWNGSETPLHVASANGRLEVVQMLLNWKADVNAKAFVNLTPLHNACSRGHAEVARLLLESEAKVDATDDGNSTPLHNACGGGYTEVARLLLEIGANVDATNKDGWTPLLLSCLRENTETIELLMEWNANANATTKDGRTALILCQNDNMRQCLQQAIRGAQEGNGRPVFTFDSHPTAVRAQPAASPILENARDGSTSPVDGSSDPSPTPFAFRDFNAALPIGDMPAFSFSESACAGERQPSNKPLELDRFSPSIAVALSVSTELVQGASAVLLPTANPDALLQFIADADRCYQHTTQVRQARQPIIDLVSRCCEVLSAVEALTPQDASLAQIATAEKKVKDLAALQDQILKSETVHDGKWAERNRVRRECIRLIDTTLKERPESTDACIADNARGALEDLRERPPNQPNDEGADLKDVCSTARVRSQKFISGLGHQSSISTATDAAAAGVREKVASQLVRECGYEGTSANELRKGMDTLVMTLSKEREFQAESAHMLSTPVELVGVLCDLEVALEMIVTVEERYSKLREHRVHLNQGLMAPDMTVVAKRAVQNRTLAKQRKRWRARVDLADSDTEAEQDLRKQWAEWEQQTRALERTADSKVAAVLQHAEQHYPELLKEVAASDYFNTVDELACAQLGLLRRGDRVDNYEEVETLSDRPGRNVSRRKDKANGEDIVLKSYHLSSAEHHTHYLRTCVKLGKLRGVLNIVPILGVFREAMWGYVIMPYYANGDLGGWIDTHPQRDAMRCIILAHQIISAVKALHDKNIVHCDLKPENIFITAANEAVLGDFDDVRDAQSTLTSAAGTTWRFAAPEITTGTAQIFEKSADVYSLGLVLERLLVSTDGDDIIERMTATDPTQRPTLQDVLSMPLFRDVHSARLCGIHLGAESETLLCRNGHVVCDDCLENFLRIDMSESRRIESYNGFLPCPLRQSGCDSLWEPRVYAPHVSRETFDAAMRLISRRDNHQEFKEEQQRQEAEDREYHYIANEILLLRCPAGHVLEESFDGCFALTCDACAEGSKNFCSFCWLVLDSPDNAHSHVRQCDQNPHPGELFHDINVFFDKVRLERCRRLKQYWQGLDMDDERRRQLAERVQPLIDQLTPAGSYGKIQSLVE